jgi:hypothetical protein
MDVGVKRNYMHALEREAFIRAIDAEREGNLSPDEREAVWSPWISLRAAAYAQSLRASLRRS